VSYDVANDALRGHLAKLQDAKAGFKVAYLD
jgi:hypothetical protein